MGGLVPGASTHLLQFTLNETGILLQNMLELPDTDTECGGLRFPHVQWTAHAANMQSRAIPRRRRVKEECMVLWPLADFHAT